MKSKSLIARMVTMVLRAALLVALLTSGWLVYRQLPREKRAAATEKNGKTNLELVIRQTPEMGGVLLDIPIEIYPVDIVAVRHEYFTERRAGKRFDDFLSERMNGRTPITAHLDRRGRTSVLINAGTWWVHAVLTGEEDLEWRLPINVSGPKQVVELTTQNAYGRTKSF
jgi:hypothetical protein